MSELINRDHWNFSHNQAKNAEWTPGLREIFEYRDLGFKDSSKGDYVAHIVRHNGKEMKDEVQKWHIHECDFQFVYVLNGWAEFEYAGGGVRRIEKGDCINQRLNRFCISNIGFVESDILGQTFRIAARTNGHLTALSNKPLVNSAANPASSAGYQCRLAT